MKKTLITTSILLTLSLGAVAGVQASTEAQKQAAIDSGLVWLAGQQQANGSWCGSGYCAADTASALLAIIEQSYKATGWGTQNYSLQVSKGLQYLMDTAGSVDTGGTKNIGTGGSPVNVTPDSNGNNTGLVWGGNEATYVTGLVLPALVRATANLKLDLDNNPATPATIITPDTVIASANSLTGGKTYKQVVQDVVDTFAWGQVTQVEGGVYRGGWRYTPSQNTSDNSTAQWGAIALNFAKNVPGVTVPTFVKDELKYWIDYIQNTNSGGAGYDSPTYLVNESKTGGLLMEMAFTGYNGTATAPDISNKDGALSFLNQHWTHTANSWDGNIGHPYAMWSIYKGLESTIGLTGSQISNFLYTNAGGLQVKDNTTDIWNWWEDYCQWLVLNQNGNGSWDGYSSWNAQLATAWGINILNATSAGNNPVPEPTTLLLFGTGLIGLASAARRRKA